MDRAVRRAAAQADAHSEAERAEARESDEAAETVSTSLQCYSNEASSWIFRRLSGAEFGVSLQRWGKKEASRFEPDSGGPHG